MKQLVVTGSFPYTSQTFVTREVASTFKADHDVYVLAPTTGDPVGEEFCDRVGFRRCESSIEITCAIQWFPPTYIASLRESSKRQCARFMGSYLESGESP